MSIHPTAVVDQQAKIHDTAEIGPFVVIEGNVEIGEGYCCRLTRIDLRPDGHREQKTG